MSITIDVMLYISHNLPIQSPNFLKYRIIISLIQNVWEIFLSFRKSVKENLIIPRTEERAILRSATSKNQNPSVKMDFFMQWNI